MSNQQNRFFLALRWLFKALVLLLFAYFVNQLPELKEQIGNFPTLVIILVAVLLAIIVVVEPEVLKETPPEELLHKLLQDNQKLINERLKNSLDQDRYIPIPSIDSPGDLERSQRKAAHKSSAIAATITSAAFFPLNLLRNLWQKNQLADAAFFPLNLLRNLWQKNQPAASFLKVIADKFPQLKSPWNLENLQTGEGTKLSPSKPIIEIFNEAERRLLILGEPGSGKTTELLKLAQALGEAAENNPKEPIPFIFELSGWRGEPMLVWMVGEIVAQYGINPKLCREWLVHNRIVPLLDGLDELGRYSNGIKEAILALNFLQADNPNQQKALVICCRVEDYESLTDDNNRRIRLKGVERAVRLCELAPDQIEGYLQQRHAEHICDELKSNSGLMKLASNPMLLNLMPIAYPDELPENLPQNPQDCQSRLFDDFLHRKLYPPQSITPHPLADYDPEKAKYYLAWLAASMGRKDINQREFLVEKLQPTWLDTKQQRNQYSLIIGLIFVMILGLIALRIYNLISVLIVGLIVGLIVAINYDNYSIYLTEDFDFSWKNIKQAISLALYYSLIGAIIFIIIFQTIFVVILGLNLWLMWWPINEVIFWLTKGIINGLIFALIIGLILGVIQGLKTDIKARKYPNQGTWETGKKCVIMMVLITPLFSLVWIVPELAIVGPEGMINSAYSLIIGAFLGILFGYLLGGGYAFTQHFVLRWVLYHHGRIPRNYVQFLNEASACGILKQYGGRYRFYHDKFREHLAATIHLKVEPVSLRKKNKFFGWFLPRR